MTADRTRCLVSRCRVNPAEEAAALGDDQEIGPVCQGHALEIEQYPERFRIRVESTGLTTYRIIIDRNTETP